MLTESKSELQWISLLLRLAIGGLFLVAALNKVIMGVDGVIAYYVSEFKDALVPMFLVKAHAALIMFVEFILAFWLLSGFKLRLGWLASAFVMLSLAMGMILAGKNDIASANFLYFFYILIGLLVCRFDQWTLDPKRLTSKQ